MVLDVENDETFYPHFERVKSELDKLKEHWDKSNAVTLKVSLCTVNCGNNTLSEQPIMPC